MKYAPYLLQRIHARWNFNAGGMDEISTYDYMGSAEYEFGATPSSLIRIRGRMDQGVRYDIVPIYTAPKHGYVQGGDVLYALLPGFLLDNTANAVQGITDGIAALIAEKAFCKESPRFHLDYAAWHDLENDYFFSPNVAYLQLIHSVLQRSYAYTRHVDRQLRIGDVISLATVLNGKSIISVAPMGIKEGKVTSILEDSVVIKARKSYRMPFAFILNNMADVKDEFQTKL